MHIFEKLPQTLGVCPIVKFRSTLENRTPQTFGRPPQPKNPACITVICIYISSFYTEYQVIQLYHPIRTGSL